jgi:hypothetical protein
MTTDTDAATVTGHTVLTTQTTWRDRVEAADWDAVRAGLDRYGCGLIGPLLTPDEAAEIAALYTDDSRFRSTINMGRHRFGEGEPAPRVVPVRFPTDQHAQLHEWCTQHGFSMATVIRGLVGKFLEDQLPEHN